MDCRKYSSYLHKKHNKSGEVLVNRRDVVVEPPFLRK